MAKEWLPHEYVPWSLGRDFDSEPWTPDQPRLTGVAQAAFEVVRVAADENLHMMFYRDIVAAALQVDPLSRGRGNHPSPASARRAACSNAQAATGAATVTSAS